MNQNIKKEEHADGGKILPPIIFKIMSALYLSVLYYLQPIQSSESSFFYLGTYWGNQQHWNAVS